MNDTIETPDELLPHLFVPCANQHLIPRGPHCGIPECGRAPEDPIHKTVTAKAA